MSQSVNKPSSIVESILRVLTTSNAILPAALPGIEVIKSIFTSGLKAGKTLEEIEAEAADSMATALRTKAKGEAQLGNQP